MPSSSLSSVTKSRALPAKLAREISSSLRLQHEIEHAQYLAGRAGLIWNWESPAGKIRWQRRVELLRSSLNNKMKVLELGCGTGYFTRQLAATGASIIAMDISPQLLAIARGECPAANVEFLLGNAYALELPNSSFDAVVGSSILHHLEITPALAEIYRVLRPGGIVRFTEPNMLNPQIAIQKQVPFIKKALGDSPDETAFFRWPLRRLMQKSRFKAIEITPFDFLHPWLPAAWINIVQSIGELLEHTPIINEIAGSLFIKASK
jgi:ubiquinone/menaquinone biosynthesis C-methylase UbiE